MTRRSKWKWNWRLGMAMGMVLMGLTVSPAQIAQNTYNLRFIGAPNNGLGASEVLDVNDSNYVVGWQSTTQNGNKQAIFWNINLIVDESTGFANYQPKPLLAPATNPDGTVAVAINNSRVIVGYEVASGVKKPVLWASSNTQGIEIFNTAEGEATDIDDRGNIAGYRMVSGRKTACVRSFFELDTSTVNLPDPSGIGPVTATGATSIDSAQVGPVYVAGWAFAGGFNRSVLWTNTGGGWTVQVLPTPGNTAGAATAYGVNASGSVVGSYANESKAFFWSAGTGSIALGSLDGGPFTSAHAYGINDNGRIVGDSFNGGNQEPFVFDAPYTPGTMQQINGGRSEADFGYFSGEILTAFSLNNFAIPSQNPGSGQIPTIVMRGSATTNPRSQAIVARAIYKGDGTTGLAIGGVKITNPNIPPGQATSISMELLYPDTGSTDPPLRPDQRSEASPTSGSNAPILTVQVPQNGGGTPITNTYLAPIAFGESESSPVNVSFTRDDAGKRILVRPQFSGFVRSPNDQYIYISNLGSSLEVENRSGLLGNAISLRARLMTTENTPQPITGQTVSFQVDNGTYQSPPVAAVTDGSGYALVASWPIDPLLGTGTRTIRATFGGRTSGDNYPYYDSCSGTGTLTATANTLLRLSLDDNPDLNGLHTYVVRPGQPIQILASLNQSIAGAAGAPLGGRTIQYFYTLVGGLEQTAPFSPGLTNINGTAWLPFDVPASPTTCEYLIRAVFAGDANGLISGSEDSGYLVVRLTGGADWTLENWLISAGHGTMGRGTKSTLIIDGSVGEPIGARDYQAGANTSRSSNGTLVAGHGFWEAWIRNIILPIKWR